MSIEIENDDEDRNNQNEQENNSSISNDDMTFDYPNVKYEYLDHTADIQIHAWGNSIEESFEQVS